MRVLAIGVGTLVAACALTWVALADAPDAPRSPFARAEVAPSDAARTLFPGGAHAIKAAAIGRVPEGLTTLDADGCGNCHVAIAAEWRASLHSASWTDPVFQAAYAREPLTFCRDCHAPMNRSGASGLPSGSAARDGISCAACHVRDGVVLGPGRAVHAPHPVRVTATLQTSDYCAPCHEFGFLSSGGPGAHGVETAELQQATFSEWRAWAKSAGDVVTCQGCHMPAAPDGHRRHDFAASRDPAMLARAVVVTSSARRDGDAVIVAFDLRPGAVGHAVPSGDLNRRLELRVATTPDVPVRGVPTIAYARSYAERNEPGLGQVRRVRDDLRVGVAEGAREVRIVAKPGATIYWQLDHLLMPRDLAVRLGIDPEVNQRVMVSGSLIAP